MCSRFLSLLVVASFWLATSSLWARQLRVCADPANLPFSNSRQQGFENRIAAVVAEDLHADLSFIWQRMGRGFVREYLNKSACDVLIGIPSDYRPVLATLPYYRSTYEFVTRRDSDLQPTSLNDSALRRMKRIGVQVLADDYTPPAEALARRGMQAAIVGFQVAGDDPEAIIRAVALKQIDAAIVWGPQAGFYAKHYGGLLDLKPVRPALDRPLLPMTFSISMGVRKTDVKLRDQLNRVLAGEQQKIHEILVSYGIPLIETTSSGVGE
jgi:mxaJ protein